MSKKVEPKIVKCKLLHQTDKGTKLRSPVTLKYIDGRIFFTKSPYAMKDEIKAFAGARWHGYDEKNPKKIWSIEDCFRNNFNLHYMMGEDVYANFDQPLREFDYTRPLMVHQKDMTNAGLTYHYQIWGAEMGLGKGHLPYTQIATPTGWTTFGEVQVGDVVINPDGGRTKVKGVFPRGRMEMFRVTFTDDSSVVCSRDHLWSVRTANKKLRGQPYETLELHDIISRGFRFNGDNKYYIPLVEPVEYDEAPLEIPPYLLGYILGNAGLTGWTNVLGICGQERVTRQETVDRLNSMMDQPLQLKKSRVIEFHIMDDKVNQSIEQLGLKGYPSSIPDAYLYNSVANRVELLQGLCDSSAYTFESQVSYGTHAPDLAEAFVSLVQSLGGICSITKKSTGGYTYNEDGGLEEIPSCRVSVSFPSTISPFKSSQKLAKYVVSTKYEPTRAITKVESIGEEECICIAVEAENQLYVTDEFIVTHNTLSAQEVIERAQVPLWYWVGPKNSLPNIQREFRKWDFDESSAVIEYMTYERLVRTMDERSPGDPVPQGVIFDESSRCKTPTSQRTIAAMKLADLIRVTYGFNGYVILMSGTPSPKRPTDWWSQAEITWPGFLREGEIKALERRLAFQVQQTSDSGTFWKTTGWRDDENKCAECGELYDEGPHEQDDLFDGEYHPYKPSVNEVALMFQRLNGLVRIYHKEDCLTLPEKRYRRVICKPKASLLRAGKTISESAQNSMIGMTLLRELSDGFQYRDEDDGLKSCNHCPDACGEVDEWFDPEVTHKTFYDISLLTQDLISKLEKRKVKCPKCHGTGMMKKTKRITKEIPCPKEPALRGLLDECEETGRIVIFAGFRGSVDRCVRICHKEGWDVVRCDGRGFTVMLADGTIVTDVEALDFWADLEANPRVAFVSHPESGGMSLTLVESRMIVYWSNSFKPEYRVQSEDRIHRKGMDENKGCVIVDLIHLPTDERVVDIIRDNRKLELMTMGKITDGLQWEGGES